MLPVPKRVFLFWSQGWDQAPELVQRVRDSWIMHNPGWEVILLDDDSLPDWIDMSVIAAADLPPRVVSDIVRLNILNDHGGVWADATMLCARPLDGWVDEAITPEGFWMYHGRDGGKGPASWFMASLPAALIILRWAVSANEFWADPPRRYEFYWMDGLFARLMQTDEDFLASWLRVPYLWCESPGSAHALAGRVYEPPDEALLQSIAETEPFAIKLSLHGYLRPDTNAQKVIDWALTVRESAPVAWRESPASKVAARWGSGNWRTRCVGEGT